MKIELEINKEDFLEIAKRYQESYEEEGYDFNLLKSNLLHNFLEEYLEALGEFEILNKQNIVQEIEKEINIEE